MSTKSKRFKRTKRVTAYFFKPSFYGVGRLSKEIQYLQRVNQERESASDFVRDLDFDEACKLYQLSDKDLARKYQIAKRITRLFLLLIILIVLSWIYNILWGNPLYSIIFCSLLLPVSAKWLQYSFRGSQIYHRQLFSFKSFLVDQSKWWLK